MFYILIAELEQHLNETAKPLLTTGAKVCPAIGHPYSGGFDVASVLSPRSRLATLSDLIAYLQYNHHCTVAAYASCSLAWGIAAHGVVPCVKNRVVADVVKPLRVARRTNAKLANCILLELFYVQEKCKLSPRSILGSLSDLIAYFLNDSKVHEKCRLSPRSMVATMNDLIAYFLSYSKVHGKCKLSPWSMLATKIFFSYIYIFFNCFLAIFK